MNQTRHNIIKNEVGYPHAPGIGAMRGIRRITDHPKLGNWIVALAVAFTAGLLTAISLRC